MGTMSTAHLYAQTRDAFIAAANAFQRELDEATADGWDWMSDSLAIGLGILPDLMAAGRTVARVRNLDGTQIKALVLYSLEEETAIHWNGIQWPWWARALGLPAVLRQAVLLVAPYAVEWIYRRAGEDITG